MKRISITAVSIILGIFFMAALALPVRAAEGVQTTWTGEAGDLYLYHEHTQGDGIPIVIMPECFGNDDLAAGGKLQTAAIWAADVVLDQADNFFGGFTDYLDIYVYIYCEDTHPVPTSDYEMHWSEEMSTVRQLVSTRLGKDTSTVRMVLVGNCDNTDQTAGQIGGHAYLNEGAMLSWGNKDDGSAWQDNPPYWARHEFFGHGFAGFLDEYEITVSSGASNLVYSTEQPSSGVVPWYDFLGFTETVEGVEQEIGICTHANPDYHGWFPTEEGFMHDANPYISQYHKWIVYQRAMQYAGTPKTLSDFCTMQGITLTPPAIDTEKDAFLVAARSGGTYQLKEDISLTDVQLDVQNDFTLDLNGHSVTVTVNRSGLSAVQIGTGKTFTVNDSAGSGKLTVSCGTGAGISTTGATLVVNGGTLDITGGDWSAGIGGRQTNNGTVIINGGNVTASGHMQSAGIGGGSGGGGGTITITGGVVTATGGTSSPYDIGNGTGGSGAVVKITGGSVNTTRKTIGATPTNGSSNVYMTTLSLEGFPNSQITALTSPSGYGTADLYTDGEGSLYFWLPAGNTNITLTAGGIEFTGAVKVEENNNNTLTLSPPGGTELPVSILSQPSNKSVGEGKSAVFTVSASGYPVPTYQWQVSTNNGGSWSNIGGATSATLTLTNVTIAGHNGNQYRCVVTNTTAQLNTVTSSAATLTVTEGFGENPATGISDMAGTTVAMLAFLAAAVALWSYAFLKRREGNGR